MQKHDHLESIWSCQIVIKIEYLNPRKYFTDICVVCCIYSAKLDFCNIIVRNSHNYQTARLQLAQLQQICLFTLIKSLAWQLMKHGQLAEGRNCILPSVNWPRKSTRTQSKFSAMSRTGTTYICISIAFIKGISLQYHRERVWSSYSHYLTHLAFTKFICKQYHDFELISNLYWTFIKIHPKRIQVFITCMRFWYAPRIKNGSEIRNGHKHQYYRKQ